MMRRAALVTVFGLAALGCGGGGAMPLFPADYASSYTLVRSCRSSPDHDLNNIRVLADPAALEPYQNRDNPFPTGAVVLKEERDPADTSCSGPILQWSVMVKLPAGSSPMTLDWHWQKVDKDRHVVTDNEPRCFGCHESCGVPPDGYQGTCAAAP